MSAASAGYLSVLFDVGGIVGGVLAGFISDQLNARATTAAVFMYLAIPSLFLFHAYGSTSKATNIGLMMISGLSGNPLKPFVIFYTLTRVRSMVLYGNSTPSSMFLNLRMLSTLLFDSIIHPFMISLLTPIAREDILFRSRGLWSRSSNPFSFGTSLTQSTSTQLKIR